MTAEVVALCNLLQSAICGCIYGLATFYMVHVLVEKDGWATVNWLFKFAPLDLATTDDILAFVSLTYPRLAHWMGCQYCMTPWWSAIFTLLFGADWLIWLTAVGVAAVLLRTFDKAN